MIVCLDWSLVGLHHHEGAMQVGWLPSVCLLELGAEDDPLIQDLIILFNNGNYNNYDYCLVLNLLLH